MRQLQKTSFSFILVFSLVSGAEPMGQISAKGDKLGAPALTNSVSTIGQFRDETRELPSWLSVAERVEVYSFLKPIGELARRLQYAVDHRAGEPGATNALVIRLAKMSYLSDAGIEKTLTIYNDLIKKQESDVLAGKRTLESATQTALELTPLVLEFPGADAGELLNHLRSFEAALKLKAPEIAILLKTALRLRAKPSTLMARVNLMRLKGYTDSELAHFISLTAAPNVNFKHRLDRLETILRRTGVTPSIALHLYETEAEQNVTGVDVLFKRLRSENREIMYQGVATLLRLMGSKNVSEQDVLARFKLALYRNPGGWQAAIALTEASYALPGNAIPALKDAYGHAFFKRSGGSYLIEPVTLAVTSVISKTDIKVLVDETNASFSHLNGDYSLAALMVASSKIRERAASNREVLAPLDFTACRPLVRSLFKKENVSTAPSGELLTQGSSSQR